VLSGAKVLDTFIREGRYWVATGQTQQGQVHGGCKLQPDGTRLEGCRYPEDLFIDDKTLFQVTTFEEVEPGKWLFDYTNDRIYFVDDPAGRKVETSVTRHAIHGDARDVTIRGLVIEKYANPAQHGAIHGSMGTTGELSSGWIVENNFIRLNHGAGVRTGHGMRVLNNRVISQGQIGIGGSGDNVLIEGNEIAHNNTQGFSWGWEGGGTKWVRTRNLVVRKNHSHSNGGPGLWTDGNNIHAIFEDNIIEDNANMGIFHEISYDAIIRNNVVRRNGFADTRWLWGSGILVAGSPNVEIYGNIVEDNAGGIGAIQQNRGSGDYGPYKLRNLWVHGNTVRVQTFQSGVACDDGDEEVFSEAGNNRFDNNAYFLDSLSRNRFAWKGNQNWDRWRSFGQDTNGTAGVIQ
jgi:parallel beta-helix repeat protein